MPSWLRNLGHSLSSLYNALPTLWSKVVDIKNKTLSLFSDVHELVSGCEEIVNDIRNFDIDPKWNSRVISAPKVVDHIKELYEVPSRIVTDVRDLVQLLKDKVEPAEVEPTDVEGLDGLPLKVAKIGEKVIGWAVILLDALVAIESAVADLNDIVDALRTTLEDLKGLDALFLQQGNVKKVVDAHYRKRLRS